MSDVDQSDRWRCPACHDEVESADANLGMCSVERPGARPERVPVGRTVSRDVIKRAPRNLREVEALLAEHDRYREALERIRDREWVENALDPQWAARIAKGALDVG